MNYQQVYWNPVLETLPQEQLKQLQLKKFRRIFKWAYDHSQCYHAHHEAIDGAIVASAKVFPQQSCSYWGMAAPSNAKKDDKRHN